MEGVAGGWAPGVGVPGWSPPKRLGSAQASERARSRLRTRIRAGRALRCRLDRSPARCSPVLSAGVPCSGCLKGGTIRTLLYALKPDLIDKDDEGRKNVPADIIHETLSPPNCFTRQPVDAFVVAVPGVAWHPMPGNAVLLDRLVQRLPQ